MQNLSEKKRLKRERWNLLVRLERLFELPMMFLAFGWLFLTVMEFTIGLSDPWPRVVNGIWIIFWIHFITQLLLAPEKIVFLKHNWLTILSLIMPALRIFRLARFMRYISLARGSHLIRVLSSINRGMNALALGLGKRGFPYVMGLTLIIVIAAAAGMMVFEKGQEPYFTSYGSALWWTSMMVTTMGTDYFPRSSEGRFLSLLLAIYGFAIFGYVTATVATLFIDKDKQLKR